MSIRISELTPKGANLEATDLLEISEVTADGFVSKSITGQEILDAIPIPRLNPQTIASVNGLNLTGTTMQISASVLIPAGTIVTNNSIYVRNLLTKTAGSTPSTGRMYLNTTNSLTGATLLASAQNMTGANHFQRFERNFFFDGTNLNGFNTTTQTPHDLAISSLTLIPFNPAIDHYLIFAVLNSTTTPDNLGHKRVIVQIYD
jgi:hypothetical protein